MKATRHAFTLVEILVSITILAIMMVMLGVMFDMFSKVFRQTGSTMSGFGDIRELITLMGREVGAAMVRSNDQRYLNFKVESTDDEKAIYFAVPNENVTKTTNMSFISHYCYFWKKDTHALYRAVQNSTLDTTALLATASSAKNDNYESNRTRLTSMTLAYRSGSPYGWVGSSEMVKAKKDAMARPFMPNVTSFEVMSYDSTPSAGGSGANTWNQSGQLPYYIEIKIGLSDSKTAARVEADPTLQYLLKYFVITVPMTGRGLSDSSQY